VEQARLLFAVQGFRTTTLEQVAAAAGMTLPAALRHFPTLAALFDAVLADVRAATLLEWETAIAEVPDPVGRLNAVIDAYLRGTRQHAEEFRLLHRALVEGDGEVREALRQFYVDCETFLARIIAEGQQSGFFRRALDPRVGAWELIRTALGYTLLQPLGIPLYEEPDYLPRAIECALQCLLKTDV
jgi:TetR/AcrR family transcriptional regulator